MNRRATAIGAIAVLIASVLGGAGTALAYFTASGSGNATATADMFPTAAGPKPAVSIAGGTATVGMSAVATLSGGVAAAGYVITRYDSTGTVSQGSTTPTCTTTSGSVSCTVPSVPVGVWRFTYQPKLGTNWLGTQSDKSDAVVAAGTKLVFTTAPVNGAAATSATLGAINVQQQDALGVPVLALSAVTVNLASNSSGATRFAASSGGAGVTSVNIPIGSSSVNFFYGDTKAGSPTITASASGLTPAAQAETITAASVAKLAFTSSAVSGPASASATLGPITVQQQDQFGNPVSGTNSRTVNLTSNSGGSAEVFAATAGGASVTSVSIPTGSNSVSFFYGDMRAGSPTITASSSGAGNVTQIETITGAAASKLVFVDCSVNGATVTATCQTSITVGDNGFVDVFVALLDQFDNVATTSAGQSWVVTLSTSNTTFFTVTPASVTISGPSVKSNGSVRVKYNGTGASNTTVTASTGGFANIQVTVKR